MKRILFFIFMLFPIISFASAPSRTNNYVSGTVIDPVAVTQNETTLYSYLQTGVDTYSPLSITTASISTTAGITYGKLNLSNGLLPGDFNTTTTTSIYQFENVLVPSTGTINYGTNHIGDILVDNGSYFVRLQQGAIGTVLTSQGNGATAPIYSFPSGQLGSYVTKATGTVFQATTDGFVSFYGTSAGSWDVSGLSDGSNPPTTKRQETNPGATTPGSWFMMVRKNDFYEIVLTGTALSSSTITFSSLGS